MNTISAAVLTVLLSSARAGVVSVPVQTVAPVLSANAAGAIAPLLTPAFGLSASLVSPLAATASMIGEPFIAPIVAKARAALFAAPARAMAARQPRSALGALRRLAAQGAGIAEDVAFIGRTRDEEIVAQPRRARAGSTAGVRLDRQPQDPELVGAISSNDQFRFTPSEGIALKADPAKPEAIEQALRRLVDSDPETFGVTDAYGLPSAEMAKVHVEFLPGAGAQADSYIAVFRQSKKGIGMDGKPYYLLVDGANLRFDIKILDGKPVLMGWEGGFAPNVDPAVMTQTFTNAELAQKAEDRLTLPQFTLTRARRSFRRDDGSYRSMLSKDDSPTPKWLTRSLTVIDGAWHALDIFQATGRKGSSVIVAVDVRTGKAWAFGENDFRSSHGFAAGPTLSGKALAHGNALTREGNDHGPAAAMPLSNAKVYGPDGKVLAVTAADGSFTLPGQGAPLTVTIKLEGIYADVTDGDKNDQPIVAKLTVLPGQTVVATLNTKGDEQSNAAVNAYVYSYALFDWFKSFLGLKDPRLYKPLAGGIHANESIMPGNAFYSPEVDGFFLMKKATVHHKVTTKRGPMTASITFENTAQPSIIFHELGHRFIQMAARVALSAAQAADPAYRYLLNPMDPVVGRAPNEAFADMVSMFIRLSPVIGSGFIVDATQGLDLPEVIRSGENEVMLDLKDKKQNADPHERGNILMGVAWKSFVDIINRMGSKGAAYAANLFVRTMLYAQPGDVVSALMHVMLADMTKDGRLPNADIIWAQARRHGVALPAPSR